MSTYLIDNRRFESDDPALPTAVALAHAARHRPICCCKDPGVEMYVAHVGQCFVLKRMPYTGARHATDCASYEPPADLSGLGQVLGSAIVEDPAHGVTRLRLGFPLSKSGSRPVPAGDANGSGSATSDGTQLTLRALLHYLWDQAGLTRWHAGFAGKRSWGTVRRHLLAAASDKWVNGQSLLNRLYVPEVFAVDQRDELNARRRVHWAKTTAAHGGTRPLMVLIGEVKEISPSRFGHKAVIKHIPDQTLALDDKLYRRLQTRFESELELWGGTDDVRLILIATFGLNDLGLPAIETLSLMPTTIEWLPVENAYDLMLVRQLVDSGRSFVKGLRYNLRTDHFMINALLTDVGAQPTSLRILKTDASSRERQACAPENGSALWSWHVDHDLPALPPRRTEAAQGCSAT